MYFHSCQGDGQRGETLLCSRVLLPAHNRPAGSESDTEEGNVCVALEEELKGAEKFIPWQDLLSLSLRYTWFHQAARPTFIIDANLFRAA